MIDEMAAVLGLLRPDLTLVLDLDVEVALSRARQRNRLEGSDAFGRFEAEEIEFHRRVREGYRLLADREPHRFVMVNAGGAPEEVASRVRSVLTKKAGLFDEAP
jgi:dTMP kinase